MRFVNQTLALLAATLLPAMAFAEPAPPEGPGMIGQFVMLGGFVLIFYFMLWRPQSKRAKEHKELVSSLKAGSEVVTAGGILGKITKVTDDNEFVVIAISDGVELKMQKSSISSVLPKGTMKSI